MNEVIRECYIEAGKVAEKVRREAASRLKQDIPLLDIAEYAENRIRELGGKPAFPCNISINEIASHYSPEDRIPCFMKGDVVKIDIGVHIDGYIADTACTVEIGTDNHRQLIRASEEALGKALASIKDNIQTGTVGMIIENTIKKYGFNPVKDLTGHSLERCKLHAGITIPNHRTFFSQKIRMDMVFAIEPFATYGEGSIIYGKPHIFAITGNSKENRDLREKFGTLPFCRRWLVGINIDNRKGLKEYREMIEASNEIVSQAEHTLIVHEDGCEVIT